MYWFGHRVRSGGFPATLVSVLPEAGEMIINTLVLNFMQEISTCLAIIYCGDCPGLEGFASTVL